MIDTTILCKICSSIQHSSVKRWWGSSEKEYKYRIEIFWNWGGHSTTTEIQLIIIEFRQGFLQVDLPNLILVSSPHYPQYTTVLFSVCSEPHTLCLNSLSTEWLWLIPVKVLAWDRAMKVNYIRFLPHKSTLFSSHTLNLLSLSLFCILLASSPTDPRTSDICTLCVGATFSYYWVFGFCFLFYFD